MTKTVSINDINSSIRSVVAMTENGDEVVLEENGKPIARVLGLGERVNSPKERTAGLGNGFWMSDDFNDELPDEFWGFDKEL